MEKTNRLYALREKFLRQEISKPEFIAQMYEFHGALFDYADYMQETEISAIEISGGEVVMTAGEHNMKFVCPRGDQRTPPVEALNFGRYEPEAEELIYKILEPGYNVFDIGANIGWYSLNFAKAYPGIKVFAFEPIPGTFGILKRNIELNRMENVTPFNFGFWEKEDTLKFHFYPDVSGAASIADILDKDGLKEVSCKVKRLDDFCRAEKARIDFIKCDVEGAEIFVYKGGLESIKQHKPVIFSEMLRKWAAKFNYHPNEIIGLLTGVGYKCFTSAEGRLVPFGKMDENTLDTNFYFLHSEKHLAKIKHLSGE